MREKGSQRGSVREETLRDSFLKRREQEFSEKGWGLKRRKELREGPQIGFAFSRGREHTLLDKFQGLLPLVNAKLVPLLGVVQIVHRNDRGCHTDHVLLSTARGGHNEVLQPLPINGLLCHLGHWGPCSQEEGWCSGKETHCGVKRAGAAPAFPGSNQPGPKSQGVRDSWRLEACDCGVLMLHQW